MQLSLKRAILVNVIPPDTDTAQAAAGFDELVRLIATYGGIVILKILQKRGRPSARTFVGEGKAVEIAQLVNELKADVVVINGFLKPNQSNHLINIIPCEVLDRFEIILKIFEKHAATPEAKLQLSIAMLKYEFPKLFGKGAMLSQQAAAAAGKASGAGARRAARGPGETLLEVKRRHLKSQIQAQEKKLAQLTRSRALQREHRKRHNLHTAALVGYTNSGKSSLLRALTSKRNVVVEDKLFSTLDTRLGEVFTGDGKILLADTIGFIQNLPPLLFSSFLATLEEVKQADLLLHVVDISDPQMTKKIEVVREILAQMGCGQTRQILVFNKIDAANGSILHSAQETFGASAIFVSAKHHQGLGKLIARMRELMPV